MNLAHLHLLLNHFPTVGFGVGLGLLLVSFIAKHNDLKRISLGIVFVIALLALPVYFSGNAAQDAVKTLPDVSEPLITSHQDAALLAFLFMELSGLVAWFSLWEFRRTSGAARWSTVALLLSIVTFALMARAANMGGEIRHPEIRS